MKNIAIVCEYNPFHNGHAHQIASLREEYGDVGIVCIMSGNYTQRGECALAPKFDRARAAVFGGADLVLELPFPYSSAGAEYFASAGVHIADSLGCIDLLSFGSECADIDKISRAAKNLRDEAFVSALERALSEDRSKGYASQREEIYEAMYGGADILSSPNNILGIEYVKALIARKSNIVPITLKRDGDRYNDTKLSGASNPSASALRALFYDRDLDKCGDYMPKEVFALYKELVENGKCPADMSRLGAAIISHLRLCDPLYIEEIAECGGGLGRHIIDSAREAKDLAELFDLCATRKYTNARIRRAVLNALIGVRESDIKKMPEYTQLLAANTKGREILRSAKKNFTILVKPAEYKNCEKEIARQIELSHRADSIYPLMLACGGRAYEYILESPYIAE